MEFINSNSTGSRSGEASIGPNILVNLTQGRIRVSNEVIKGALTDAEGNSLTFTFAKGGVDEGIYANKVFLCVFSSGGLTVNKDSAVISKQTATQLAGFLGVDVNSTSFKVKVSKQLRTYHNSNTGRSYSLYEVALV